MMVGGKERDVPPALIRSLAPARHALHDHIPIQAGYAVKTGLIERIRVPVDPSRRWIPPWRRVTRAGLVKTKDTPTTETHTRPDELRAGQSVYEGRVQDDGVVDFFGMRYALPPIGVRRFAPPEAYVGQAEREIERGVDASRWGKRCMQSPSALRPASDMSEHCLTVNVFRPAGLDTAKPVPVMVWIYGGGFQSGTASVYNATFIVRQSVALVSPCPPNSLFLRVAEGAGVFLFRDELRVCWGELGLELFAGVGTSKS